MKQPKLKAEMAWSVFKCMFVLCLSLCLLLGGLFAYYMHKSFNGTTIDADMNQVENNYSNQSITNE